MRNRIKFAFVIAVLCVATSTSVFGQKTIKLGHIDSNELLKIMPGRDSIQTVLQTTAAELEKTLMSMQSELEARYNDYMKNKDQMSDLIRQTKEKELQDMSMRVQEFRENAQKDLQEKERTLLTPIIDKAKNAISDVAKENKYTYVFDAGIGSLLYFEDSDDIMPMVKKKLGLK